MHKEFKINFVRNLKKCLIVSAAIFLVSIVMCFVFGPVLDIDFKGGTRITYSYTGSIDVASFDSIAEKQLGKKLSVNKSTDMTGSSQKLTLSLAENETLSAEKVDGLLKELQKSFADNSIKQIELNTVSPSIGLDQLLKSLYAVAVAGLFIIIYVAIRFRRIGGLSAGVAAMMALLHDVFIAFFACVIFRLEIDQNFIAVVLTLFGYSLNSTIVVFDRIRENRRIDGASVPLGELVTRSCNQVFTRTIVTTLTTFIAVATILTVAELMGLTSLRSLTIPMLLGLVSGAYSSVCLAPATWVKWQEHSEKAGKSKKTKKKTV